MTSSTTPDRDPHTAPTRPSPRTPRRTRQPSPTDAPRLGDVHFVDRYDRHQLTLLARLDHPSTPLVVPRGTDRVCQAEPTHRVHGRLTITAVAPRPTRDAVIVLLDHGLLHGEDLVAVDDHGEHRTAHLLTLTRHGRELLDVARRIGRLPR